MLSPVVVQLVGWPQISWDSTPVGAARGCCASSAWPTSPWKPDPGRPGAAQGPKGGSGSCPIEATHESHLISGSNWFYIFDILKMCPLCHIMMLKNVGVSHVENSSSKVINHDETWKK